MVLLTNILITVCVVAGHEQNFSPVSTEQDSLKIPRGTAAAYKMLQIDITEHNYVYTWTTRVAFLQSIYLFAIFCQVNAINFVTHFNPVVSSVCASLISQEPQQKKERNTKKTGICMENSNNTVILNTDTVVDIDI